MMFWKCVWLKVILNIDFTWKISSLYFNFTLVIFNILGNNLYDDILQLILDPVINSVNSIDPVNSKYS